MWDSSLHLYKKYKTFTKKYNVLFCSHYSLSLNLWYGLGPSFTSQLLVWAWAELYVSTSGMGSGRALCLNFWYGLGSSFIFPFYKKGWAMLFVGLFHILISPPPITPQIFTLCRRERFDRNSGEICVIIQSSDRNVVVNSMVSHSIREYGSVRYYRFRTRTNRSVLWVVDSVINSEKSEPERCGDKINSSNLMFYRALDDKTSW
jgi:hypothetical protein